MELFPLDQYVSSPVSNRLYLVCPGRREERERMKIKEFKTAKDNDEKVDFIISLYKRVSKLVPKTFL